MTMSHEKAVEIADHLKDALANDQAHIAIRKSNATRIQFALSSLERRIANGEFPTIAMLRNKFDIKAGQK